MLVTSPTTSPLWWKLDDRAGAGAERVDERRRVAVTGDEAGLESGGPKDVLDFGHVVPAGDGPAAADVNADAGPDPGVTMQDAVCGHRSGDRTVDHRRTEFAGFGRRGC